jgi:hypothetical protein
MCIFSAVVDSVADTRIFARRHSAAEQFLVYSMQYEAAGELAMTLPLPTSRAAGEDAVDFIDLSGYSRFFLDLESGFPEPRPRGLSMDGPAAAAPLKVHQVGSFEASFVPDRADFGRLDARFRLPDMTWDQLPVYADYGFAVFKLKAGAKKIHPMAFRFHTRDPERLFFPTVHVHDGGVDFTARFDHALYCQTGRHGLDWRASSSDAQGNRRLPAGSFMKVDATLGIVAPDQSVFKKRILGFRRNEDVWLAG